MICLSLLFDSVSKDGETTLTMWACANRHRANGVPPALTPVKAGGYWQAKHVEANIQVWDTFGQGIDVSMKSCQNMRRLSMGKAVY